MRPETARYRFLAQVGRRLAPIFGPLYRYRHARAIHAVRVGIAMATSLVATAALPHGIWSSVTVLVVIGGLQHHGNIRKKAGERAIGTLLGAAVGLLCIAVQAAFAQTWLTFLVMSFFAAVCAYYAIGKAGYIALLAAITMCIVAEQGDAALDVGLWRTANVLIGIVIALAFSFALPLHATYSWRYLMAENLRLCAHLAAQLERGGAVDRATARKHFATLSRRLVQLRNLMPSVAKELGVPLRWLDDVQREHRVLIAALDILLELSVDWDTGNCPPPGAASRAALYDLRNRLGAMSRALKLGRVTRLQTIASASPSTADAARTIDPPAVDAASRPPAVPAAAPITDPSDRAGLLAQVAQRTERLRDMLLAESGRWRRGGSLGR
ncbi:FUSC family protein [Chitinasiproducens palmae]|uniref:Fusaric acid resistance protein-like n=1 Tax=Chitinasiproducens palmae TaxID=1770053 RepID=A0A1H2PQS2_9BURK|nr:FUSC family protein [Chitinasiproducens palmae]SDV49096.1 Fusaric acid resistance protein-like [Chitinasiproducens palmae]